VRLDSSVRHHVQHRPIPDRERIGDELTVAAPPRALGAHERGPSLLAEPLELHEAGLEFRGRHVIGIAAEPADSPAGVRRVRGSLAPPAEGVTETRVGDPGAGQRFLECGGVEVGEAAGGGEAPDVGHSLYAVAVEQGEEPLLGVGGVADREDLAPAHTRLAPL
jgi:hypothetical protein